VLESEILGSGNPAMRHTRELTLGTSRRRRQKRGAAPTAAAAGQGRLIAVPAVHTLGTLSPLGTFAPDKTRVAEIAGFTVPLPFGTAFIVGRFRTVVRSFHDMRGFQHRARCRGRRRRWWWRWRRRSVQNLRGSGFGRAFDLRG
jgi:hypothetical protein